MTYAIDSIRFKGLGGVRVAEYRIYCLDHFGVDVDVRPIVASNDEDAIEQARALKGLRQCEVWRGKRLIATVTEFDTEQQTNGGSLVNPNSKPSF